MINRIIKGRPRGAVQVGGNGGLVRVADAI